MSANSTKNDRSPPWDQEADKESVGFGRWLRRQREMREVPLREIADVTKISLRYLEALEQDRFDVLPAPVFAKGFLREYSRYVGLDSDEVVNSFLIATGEIVETEEAGDAGESSESMRGRTRTLLFAVAAILIIAVIVVAVALVSRARAERPVKASPIAAPVPPPIAVQEAAPGAEPAAAVAPPLTVTIDFTEDCWMEAVVDRERTISELRVQGESMRLEAEEVVSLTLGNPAGVRVEVNGQPFDFADSPGRIVKELEIDLALAEQLAGGES